MIFSILDTNNSTTDYTNKVLADDYKVNKTKVEEIWSDGNVNEHRRLKRSRITGTFKMRFIHLSDYQAFIADLEAKTTTGGYVLARIFCVNTQTVESAALFIDYTPTMRQKKDLTYEVLTLDITVKER